MPDCCCLRALSSLRWGALALIIDLILSALIIAGLPLTAAWAPGTLVGIDMTFNGFALTAMALPVRMGGFESAAAA